MRVIKRVNAKGPRRAATRVILAGQDKQYIRLTSCSRPARCETKRNESGFRPPVCTYRLNWAGKPPEDGEHGEMIEMTLSSRHRIRNWSEAEHATSRSRRLPTILTFTRGWGRNSFCFFQTAETGNRTLNSGVKGSGANHYLGPPPRCETYYHRFIINGLFKTAIGSLEPVCIYNNNVQKNSVCVLTRR